MDLALQRCRNHPQREAAARCPSCGGFFCRECVTEHENRILCAGCLAGLVRPAEKKRRSFAWAARLGQGLTGLVIAWLVFYYLAEILMTLPAAFHEGGVWETLSR